MTRARLRVPMLLVLALALLGATASPPGNVIRVKGVAGDTVLSLVASEAGGLLRLDLMARLLGGSVDAQPGGRARLVLYGTALEFQVGSAFAAYNGFVLPLIEPVREVDGALHAPLQVFSEIVPRFGVGILWDRSRWEVRLFQGIARRTEPSVLREAGRGTDAPAVTTVAAVTNASAPRPAAAPPVAESGTRSAAAPPATTPIATPVATPTSREATGRTRRFVVAVDAGHGGHDPGNPGVVIGGRRVNESKLTLAMALALELELRNRGLDVVMTRKRDTLIARDDRGPLANARKADLFVSLHTNAANPSWRNGAAVRGAETYFLSTARTEDERRVASMENDVVRFETASETAKGDPLSFILNDLAQNEHLRESFDLATLVQGKLAAKHPGPNRGVKQAGFAVLATAYMPAILVEVGFGTNAADARWMASAAGQRDIAVSVADGIVEYLQHYERRTRGAAR